MIKKLKKTQTAKVNLTKAPKIQRAPKVNNQCLLKEQNQCGSALFVWCVRDKTKTAYPLGYAKIF